MMPTATTKKGAPRKYSRHMTLLDYSDYDLLHVVDDHSGQGSASLGELLERDARSVAQRLSWMRRKGYVGRLANGGWIVARKGRRLLETRGGAIADARELAQHVTHDTLAGWVINREYRRGLK